MALGLLLWVSWISLLLNFSVGLTVKKGFRVIEDSNNLQDDRDDDALNSQGQAQASNNQPARVGLGNYNHPIFAQWQDLVSTLQNPPTAPSVPATQQPVTVDPSRWRQQNPPTTPSVAAQRPVIRQGGYLWQQNQPTKQRPVIRDGGYLWQQNQPTKPSVPAAQRPVIREGGYLWQQNQPTKPSVPATQRPVIREGGYLWQKNQPTKPSVPATQRPVIREQSHRQPQNQLDMSRVPVVQGPATGGWMGFWQQDLHGPLIFPLSSNQPAAPQPPNQDTPHTASGVHTNSQPVYPSSGDASRYSSQVASHQPVSSPTVQEPWRTGPVNRHYGVPQPGLGSQHQGSTSRRGDDSSSHPNFVFERVSQPSLNNMPGQSFDAISHTAARRGQANLGQGSSAGYTPTVQQQPPNVAFPFFYNFWEGLPSAPFFYGGGDFNAMNQRARNQVFRTQRVKPVRRVMPVHRARPVQSVNQPTASRRYRPTYLYRSRSGYHRGRFLHSHTSYKPEYLKDAISMTSSTGFQEPPESQPPAPKA